MDGGIKRDTGEDIQGLELTALPKAMSGACTEDQGDKKASTRGFPEGACTTKVCLGLVVCMLDIGQCL